MSHLARLEAISSPQNPILKEIKRATGRGGLTSDGCCVAEGFHLLEEALRSDVEIVAVVATESAVSAAAGLADRNAPERTLKTRFLSMPEALFRTVSSTENAQGVLALVRPPSWTEDDVFGSTPLVLVLDGIQDPGNAGTLLRAAEGFGATGAVLLKGTVSPWNPKMLRASAGSLFRLPILDLLTPAGLLEVFTRRNIPLWMTVASGGQHPGHVDLMAACGLVIGNEAHGISEEIRLSGKGLSIPTRSVESLNAAVAGSILLYEAARQRGKM